MLYQLSYCRNAIANIILYLYLLQVMFIFFTTFSGKLSMTFVFSLKIGEIFIRCFRLVHVTYAT